MNAIQVTAPSALVNGSSRGIGRGIVVKLAECGVARIGIHYLKNKDDAEQTARLGVTCLDGPFDARSF